MGTRHLTIVQKKGEYRVAQYGQWDGYPEYTGKKVLEFCKEHLSTQEGRDTFGEKVCGCKFVSDEMVDDIIEGVNRRVNGYDENYRPHWAEIYPQFSRDTGCDILNLVLNSNNGMLLQNTIEFIKDSLFCEWAWVIDLDKNTFEAFRGFNRRHLGKSQRFYKFDNEKDAKWKPCRFVAGWNLDNLPTEEHFMEAFKESDDE